MSCARATGLDEAGLASHVPTCAVCRSRAAIVDTAVAHAPGSRGDVVDMPTVDPSLYIKHDELGAGGMGRTYRAFERRLGRVVALKQIRTDTAVDAHSLEVLFDREARLTARLQHPSIVAIYEAGKLGDAPFYAMRLVDGVPLDREIARRKSLAERLALVSHVVTCAHAIAYAHDQRIVHRDLKPANIVIGKFGEAIVIDWGVACALDEPAAKEKGHSVGTPAYMPPEQADGEPAAPSFDVYALGATLYHVLAGHAPYADLPPAKLSAADLRVTPLAERAPGAPADLVAIVDKALARDRAERYATAAQLADDLSHFLAGRLVAAYEYTRAERLVRWLKKHRISVSIAVLATTIVAAVSVISVRRIVAAREDAQARADELVLGRARDLLASDPTASLAWLAQYPADGPDREDAALIRAEASSLGVARHVLAGNRREVRDVAVSPDGARIASAGDDGCVWTWVVATGAGRALGCTPSPAVRIAYAPDGARVASLTIDGELRLWDAIPGVMIAEVATGPSGRAVVWSPDGKHLATAGDAVRVWPADLAGAPVELAAADDVFDIAFSPSGDAIAAGGRATLVQIWNLRAPGAPPRVFSDLADGVMQLRFSPDGSRLAAAGRDQKTHVWDLATGAPTSFDDGWLVRTVAFSPDGKSLVSAGEGAVIHLRDLASGTLRPLAGHRGAVIDVTFTADGTQLVSASLDQSVRVWDVASGTSRPLLGHRDIIDRVVVTRDGALAVSCGKDHAVRVWPLRGEPSTVIAVKNVAATDVVFAPGGGTKDGSLASAWGDGVIRIGDRPACQSAKAARQLAFSPDGASLVWVGHDREAHACDVATGTTRALVAPDAHAEVFALAFAGDGQFVTGGIDKTVRAWALDGTSRTLFTHKGGVWTVAVSPDGKRFASGGLDGVLAVGELDGAVHKREGHSNHINAVVFSPDGTHVATASDDETVRLWPVDRESGVVQVLDMHRTVDTVAFSEDGRLLAAGAHDGSVRLWEVSPDGIASPGGRVVARHHASAKTIAFSPRGHYVASGGVDGSVWLVDLEHDAERVYVTSGPIQRVAFSPDGQRLAAAGAQVQIWTMDERIAPADTTARVDDAGEIWTPRP